MLQCYGHNGTRGVHVCVAVPCGRSWASGTDQGYTPTGHRLRIVRPEQPFQQPFPMLAFTSTCSACMYYVRSPRHTSDNDCSICMPCAAQRFDADPKRRCTASSQPTSAWESPVSFPGGCTDPHERIGCHLWHLPLPRRAASQMPSCCPGQHVPAFPCSCDPHTKLFLLTCSLLWTACFPPASPTLLHYR